MNASAGECEVEGCARPARFTIRGQWSEFDWLDVGTCREHWDHVWHWLEIRTVDGERVRDMYTVHTW